MHSRWMEHCQLFFVMAVLVILTLRYSDTYITRTNIKEIIRIWPPLFANITANMFPVRMVLVRGEVHLTAHRIAHLHHGSRGRAVSTAVLAAARGREHHSWLLSWLLRDYSEYQRLMKPNSALQHAIDKYSCIELWITQISSYYTETIRSYDGTACHQPAFAKRATTTHEHTVKLGLGPPSPRQSSHPRNGGFVVSAQGITSGTQLPRVSAFSQHHQAGQPPRKHQ